MPAQRHLEQGPRAGASGHTALGCSIKDADVTRTEIETLGPSFHGDQATLVATSSPGPPTLSPPHGAALRERAVCGGRSRGPAGVGLFVFFHSA